LKKGSVCSNKKGPLIKCRVSNGGKTRRGAPKTELEKKGDRLLTMETSSGRKGLSQEPKDSKLGGAEKTSKGVSCGPNIPDWGTPPNWTQKKKRKQECPLNGEGGKKLFKGREDLPILLQDVLKKDGKRTHESGGGVISFEGDKNPGKKCGGQNCKKKENTAPGD